MDHIEVLLHVWHADGGRTPISELARALALPESIVERCVRDLAAAGLVDRDAGGVFHSVRGASDRQTLEALEREYNERPLALVRALRGRPSSVLRSFSDAFRFRPDGE
jgi:hypothetical protein